MNENETFVPPGVLEGDGYGSLNSRKVEGAKLHEAQPVLEKSLGGDLEGLRVKYWDTGKVAEGEGGTHLFKITFEGSAAASWDPALQSEILGQEFVGIGNAEGAFYEAVERLREAEVK